MVPCGLVFAIPSYMGTRGNFKIRLITGLAVALSPMVNFAAHLPIFNEVYRIETPKKSEETTSRHLDLSFDYEFAYKDANRTIDIHQTARIALEMQKHRVFQPGKYIPLHELPAQTNDQGYIANQILRQTVQTWLDEKKVEHKELIEAVEDLDDIISTEMKLSGDSKNDWGKLKMRYRLTSSQAQLRYEGVFGAQLSYNIENSDTQFEITHKIEDTTLVYNHTEDGSGRADQLGIRWSF